MTAAEFTSLCQQLYGDHWQPELARVLARDIRTIRRWKSGESPVPKVVQDWLLAKQAGR